MVQAGEKEPEILPPPPPSTVDLGLNRKWGDFWDHERFGPLLRACLPRLPRPDGAQRELPLKALPEKLPRAVSREELDVFLKALIDAILEIE